MSLHNYGEEIMKYMVILYNFDGAVSTLNRLVSGFTEAREAVDEFIKDNYLANNGVEEFPLNSVICVDIPDHGPIEFFVCPVPNGQYPEKKWLSYEDHLWGKE
jgi:hypothetical protein